jgi:hypothetical protein
VGRPSFLIAAPVIVLLLAAGGCGGGEQVPDDEIVEALKLEQSRDRPVYAIGGDPFCEVDENLLNDADEVDAASEKDELGLVITDADQAVGVEAVPPFDPECAKKAKRALNRL